MSRRILLCVVAVFNAPALSGQAGPDPLAALRARRPPLPLAVPALAITHVRVVPMDSERTLLDQTVVVRDGRIASLGPADRAVVPPDARIVDGRGLTLLPGLADMHIHLRYLAQAGDNPAILELLVAHGVTTALNLLGLDEHLLLRAAIDSGRMLGPVLYTSGFWVNTPFVRTVAQVDSAVRVQRAAGFDVIKIHGELDSATYHALFAAARREGIPVVGHASHVLGLRALLEEHQYAVAHAEEYLYAWFLYRRTVAMPADSVVPLIQEAARATAAAHTWVTPTLAVFWGILPQMSALDSVRSAPDVRYWPPSFVADLSPSTNPYANRQNFPLARTADLQAEGRLLELLTLALQRAGVRLVFGTDAGVPGMPPGFGVHRELAALVRAGLTPYEALRTATANAAAFVAAESEFGTVAVGLRADLVLVRGDPLADVSVLRRPEGVVLRGRLLDRAALDAMLERLAATRPPLPPPD